MLGFYNVIKPTGVSSGYVVNKIKWLTKEKVGHLGTLDPLASGVLPIAVGKATRFFDYFLNKDKVYFALMKVGYLTDTLDSEGEIVEVKSRPISEGEVQDAVSCFVGESFQVPPIYSARSVNGVRGYQAAVQNKELKLEAKKVSIYSIEARKWNQDDVFALRIHCSSGTYVRSIIRDVGNKLGVVCTTVAIIRLKSGPFRIENAVTIEDIANNKEQALIRINDILNKPVIELSEKQAKDILSGKKIKLGDYNGEFLLCYDGKEFCFANLFLGEIKSSIYLYGENL